MKHFQTPTPQSPSCRRWVTSLIALTGACLALLPQGLYAHDSLSSPVPTAIEVPAGHRPFLRGYAVGTQNYMCLPCPSPLPSPLPCPSDFAWTLVGPQATLFNDGETQIITHFLSPNPDEGDMARATWQDSRDTSAVWAKLKRSDAIVDVEGAIPWLLLEVVGSESGPTEGDERLTDTTHIQRVHTSGGLAPTDGCGSSTVGAREFIPYTADYIFYKATRRK